MPASVVVGGTVRSAMATPFEILGGYGDERPGGGARSTASSQLRCGW